MNSIWNDVFLKFTKWCSYQVVKLTAHYLYCLFAASDYGLFLSDEDPKKGIWLEAGKALDYYMLRNGVSVEYFIN